MATAVPNGGVTGYKDVGSENTFLNAVTSVGLVSLAIEAHQSSSSIIHPVCWPATAELPWSIVCWLLALALLVAPTAGR